MATIIQDMKTIWHTSDERPMTDTEPCMIVFEVNGHYTIEQNCYYDFKSEQFYVMSSGRTENKLQNYDKILCRVSRSAVICWALRPSILKDLMHLAF